MTAVARSAEPAPAQPAPGPAGIAEDYPAGSFAGSFLMNAPTSRGGTRAPMRAARPIHHGKTNRIRPARHRAQDDPGGAVGVHEPRHREPVARGHRGADIAGADAGHRDALPPQAERRRHRPGVRRRLGRAVSRRGRPRDEGGDRGDHGDPPPPAVRAGRLGSHGLDRRQDGVQHAVEVGGEDGAGLCRALHRLFPGPGGDAGVRHHQVEHPGRRHPRLHRRLVRYIDGLGQRGRAAGLAGVANRLQPAGIAAGQMQHHAGRGERQRERLADPGGGAGDQHGGIPWHARHHSVVAARRAADTTAP